MTTPSPEHPSAPVGVANPSVDADPVIEWVGKPGNVEQERLRAALLDAARQLSVAHVHGRDVAQCRRCLRTALGEAVAKRWYSAWDNLHQFDIAYLTTLDEEGRQLAWNELREEADEKLTGWRDKATERQLKLLGERVPSAQMLAAVRTQLARQSQNAWLKREKLRAQGPYVLVASLGAIAFFLTTSALGWYEALAPNLAGAMWIGVLAAVLGGVISVATSIGATDLNAKIPAVTFAIMGTALRPVVGGVCAIPVVFLVYSGFVKLGGLTDLWTTVLLCLVTGFSERWFLGVLARVTAGAKG